MKEGNTKKIDKLFYEPCIEELMRRVNSIHDYIDLDELESSGDTEPFQRLRWEAVGLSKFGLS